MIRTTTTTRALRRTAIVKTVPLPGEIPPADSTQNEATRSGAADASPWSSQLRITRFSEPSLIEFTSEHGSTRFEADRFQETGREPGPGLGAAGRGSS